MFEKILGEYCARCGKARTKADFEGLPTCDNCKLEIESDREEKRPCPNCHTEMEKTIVMNVIIDKCPSCHGAWLDGGELDLLQQAVQSGGGDFATGMVLGMAMG